MKRRRRRFFFLPSRSASPLTRHRPQKVRIRRQYATSVFRRFMRGVWRAIKIVVFAAVVAGGTAWFLQFWNTSPLVRVSEVVVGKHLPQQLKKIVPITPGENIFLLKTRKMEETALKTLPQLKSLSIRRTMNRQIVVSGELRTAVLRFGPETQAKGVDETGKIFPLEAKNNASFKAPVLDGPATYSERQQLAHGLFLIKTQVPAFYSRISRLKTDRILPLQLELLDGTKILWRQWHKDNVVGRAKNVMTILKHFKPARQPATLKFVEDDRVVMNANWKGRD